MTMSGVTGAGVGVAVLGAVALGLGLANLRLKMISEAATIALSTGGVLFAGLGLGMALAPNKTLQSDARELTPVTKRLKWSVDDSYALSQLAMRAQNQDKSAKDFAEDLSVIYLCEGQTKDDESRAALLRGYGSQAREVLYGKWRGKEVVENYAKDPWFTVGTGYVHHQLLAEAMGILKARTE